jgi:hypothetical protein
MAKKASRSRTPKRNGIDTIPEGAMTKASDRDERPDGKPKHTPMGDRHAAGTPAGGSAVGGLGGTNIDEGSPQNDDLEKHEGSGIEDTIPDELDDNQAYWGVLGRCRRRHTGRRSQ